MNSWILSLTLVSMMASSCAFAARRNDEYKKVVASAKETPAAPAPVPAPPAAEAEEELPPAKPPSSVTSKPAPGTHEEEEETSHDHTAPVVKSGGTTDDHGVAVSVKPAASAAHAAPSSGVPAEQSLKWLMNGNTRYVKKQFRADGRAQVDRDRTKAGQHPHAIVLSCADSRVPPEHVFDQGLGE
ncbi:MAG: hypothetical protein AAB250_12095, partial [Bdellovibrionota bacterium]